MKNSKTEKAIGIHIILLLFLYGLVPESWYRIEWQREVIAVCIIALGVWMAAQIAKNSDKNR